MSKRRTYGGQDNAAANGGYPGLLRATEGNKGIAAPGPDLSSIDWAAGARRSGGGGRVRPLGTAISLSTGKADNWVSGAAVLISVYEGMMQHMGWRIGDRVLVAYTADRAWLMLRRVLDDSGYKLSAGNVKDAAQVEGTVRSANVRTTAPTWLRIPLTFFTDAQVTIDRAAGIIAIPLPGPRS